MPHTPGPWTAEYDEYGGEIWYGGAGCGLWTINGPAGCHLAANYYHYDDDIDGEKSKADAKLIASSPDLLETLKWVYEQRLDFIECAHGEEILERVKKAIEKAEGRT